MNYINFVSDTGYVCAGVHKYTHTHTDQFAIDCDVWREVISCGS